MKKLFILLIFSSLLLSGCGFHLQGKSEIPKQFSTLSFHSSNPYGKLSREIKTILNNNQVILKTSDKEHPIPELNILNSNFRKDTISLYQDGKSAEYQLILTVNAQVVIANSDNYPMKIKVFRTFFDNPATALAKSTEEDQIKNEMYAQAARQIIGKLKSINAINENTDKL